MPQAFRIAMVPVADEDLPPLDVVDRSLFFLCETCWQIVGAAGWDSHVEWHAGQQETVAALDERVAAIETAVVAPPPVDE